MGRYRNLIFRALAVTVILVGLQKTAWVVYNVFIDAQPEFIASSARSAGVSMVIGVLLVMLGGLLFTWCKSQPHHIDDNGLTPAVEQTVRELVAQGRKDEAVGAYRAATGTDQVDAEVAVTRMSRAA